MFVLCFPLQSQASKKFQNFILGQVRDAGNSLLHCCEVVRGKIPPVQQYGQTSTTCNARWRRIVVCTWDPRSSFNNQKMCWNLAKKPDWACYLLGMVAEKFLMITASIFLCCIQEEVLWRSCHSLRHMEMRGLHWLSSWWESPGPCGSLVHVDCKSQRSSFWNPWNQLWDLTELTF